MDFASKDTESIHFRELVDPNPTPDLLDPTRAYCRMLIVILPVAAG